MWLILLPRRWFCVRVMLVGAALCVRASTVSAGLTQTTRIMLLAADGVTRNTEIVCRVRVTRQTVVSWRARCDRPGLGGLDDEKRSEQLGGSPRHHGPTTRFCAHPFVVRTARVAGPQPSARPPSLNSAPGSGWLRRHRAADPCRTTRLPELPRR